MSIEETKDEMRDEVMESLELVQSYADEMFVGDERYSKVVLWDDGDFRVVVHHGFPTREHTIHHAERVTFKHSEGVARYQIVVKPWYRERRIIRSVEL